MRTMKLTECFDDGGRRSDIASVVSGRCTTARAEAAVSSRVPDTVPSGHLEASRVRQGRRRPVGQGRALLSTPGDEVSRLTGTSRVVVVVTFRVALTHRQKTPL